MASKNKNTHLYLDLVYRDTPFTQISRLHTACAAQRDWRRRGTYVGRHATRALREEWVSGRW